MKTKTVENNDITTKERRIAAFLIDQFVISFSVIAIVLLVLGPNFMDEKGIGKIITANMWRVIVPVFFLFFVKDLFKGMSFGKWIMEIAVRDKNNPIETPSLQKLLLRNVPLIIWPIEFVFLTLNPKKQRIGDVIAKTIVVRNTNKLARTPRVLALVGVVIVFFSFIIFFSGSVMKNSDAYKVAIHEIENSKEILEATGGITGYGMLPSGEFSYSKERSRAYLGIKVIGKDNNLLVDVYLTKEPNEEWKLIKIR